jgi:phosphatidate cytidylyltransferase
MLGARLLTIAVALPLFVAALLWLPPLLWALLLLIGLAIAASEWSALAGFSPRQRIAFLLAIAGSACALLIVAAVLPAAAAARLELWVYAISCMFWLGVAPFWLARRWATRDALVLALAGWIVLVPMWLALTRLQATPWLLLLILSVVWIADSAAYLAGRRWGRTRLAPVVSPGKSWEGVAGAAGVLALYYLLLWFIVPAGQAYFGAGIAAALFAALLALSIEGDLFESWMKRQAGVKDSGQLLPGHGGVLDRIDGLTSTVPAAALLFYLT